MKYLNPVKLTVYNTKPNNYNYGIDFIDEDLILKHGFELLENFKEEIPSYN